MDAFLQLLISVAKTGSPYLSIIAMILGSIAFYYTQRKITVASRSGIPVDEIAKEIKREKTLRDAGRLVLTSLNGTQFVWFRIHNGDYFQNISINRFSSLGYVNKIGHEILNDDMQNLKFSNFPKLYQRLADLDDSLFEIGSAMKESPYESGFWESKGIRYAITKPVIFDNNMTAFLLIAWDGEKYMPPPQCMSETLDIFGQILIEQHK